MKKLLSTKKTDEKNEHYIKFKQFKSDVPKRMVTSTWNTRNDSSNISSILQPENYVQSPKTTDKGVFKKCLLADNTCYCREKKIRPKLISKPKTCLSLDNLKNQLTGSDLLRRPFEESHAFQECHCKGKDVADTHDNTTDLTLLKRYGKELEKKCDCLQYTDSRKDYHIFRQEQEEDDLKQLEKYYEAIDTAEEDEEEHEGDKEEEEDYSLTTIMGTRPGMATTLSSFNEDHENLGTFRNEHYFDTHSTGDMGKEVPRHTCVHQFRLDDRLLPEPLNIDPYGRSRCSICLKPMEGATTQTSKPYFSDRPSSATLRNLAKGSELGLVPRSISIGGDKSKIELRVDAGDQTKLGMVVGKIRKPEYFNTFALRQQRMSC